METLVTIFGLFLIHIFIAVNALFVLHHIYKLLGMESPFGDSFFKTLFNMFEDD